MTHKTMRPVPRVLSDLATLAPQDPLLYVRRHSRPITTLPDQLCGPLYALVAMFSVQLTQSFLLEGGRQDELKKLFPPI
ncbi:unnamed protein product [Merluccius merluccius]